VELLVQRDQEPGPVGPAMTIGATVNGLVEGFVRAAAT
jgi:hypothetical protein